MVERKICLFIKIQRFRKEMQKGVVQNFVIYLNVLFLILNTSSREYLTVSIGGAIECFKWRREKVGK